MNDRDQPATRGDVENLRDEMNSRFAQVDERFAKVDERFAKVDARFDQMDARFHQMDKRFDQMDERFEEVRRHFDVTAESFRSEFRSLFDFVQANDGGLSSRIESIETGHGARLGALENRVTRLEKRRP